TDWQLLGTDWPSTFGTIYGIKYVTYWPQFANGEGTYEYYSIAFDPYTAVREAPPLDQVPPAAAQAHVIYDYTKPTSTAGAVPARITKPRITIPYTASDGNGIGLSGVGVYTRYRATQDQAWSDWWQIGGNEVETADSITVDLPVWTGEGF